MPCNLVAIRKAKAHVDPKLVLDHAQVIANMKNLIAPIVGMTPSDITAYSDNPGTDWGVGWGAWIQTKQGVQIPAEQLTGGQYVDWVCNKCAIRLERNGTITLRDGWDLPASKHFSPEQAEQVLESVNAALNQVLGLLFQQQVKNALAAKFNVESAQTTQNGALVVTMEI